MSTRLLRNTDLEGGGGGRRNATWTFLVLLNNYIGSKEFILREDLAYEQIFFHNSKPITLKNNYFEDKISHKRGGG